MRMRRAAIPLVGVLLAAAGCATKSDVAQLRTTLLSEIQYIELSDRTDFQDRFVDQLAFPT